MKTRKITPLFSLNYYGVKGLVVFSFLSVITLSACTKDKAAVVPVAPFAGTYEGTKANNTKYTMTIEHKSGLSFQIKNFIGFLNAPLNATTSGIASQFLPKRLRTPTVSS